MNNSDAYTYILNNILEYKQMIIANSLWIYSFAKFEKIDEFKGMVELAHHFELISDKEKGELTCEACGFDFEKAYGSLGKGYIECHHLIPLSNFDSKKETKMEDLALLCSNCHRMIHKDLGLCTIESFIKCLNTRKLNTLFSND